LLLKHNKKIKENRTEPLSYPDLDQRIPSEERLKVNSRRNNFYKLITFHRNDLKDIARHKAEKIPVDEGVMQDDFTLLLFQLLYSTFPSRAITGDYEKINFNVDTMKSERALCAVAKDENLVASGFGAIRKIS